jgi:hypothetical protein
VLNKQTEYGGIRVLSKKIEWWALAAVVFQPASRLIIMYLVPEIEDFLSEIYCSSFSDGDRHYFKSNHVMRLC